MKKLITFLFLLLASCQTYQGAYYTQDGIYFSNTDELDSLQTKVIRIRYYPIYIYRNNPYYNYYQPYRYWEIMVTILEITPHLIGAILTEPV